MQEELNDHLVDVSSPSISIVNLSALRGQQIMGRTAGFSSSQWRHLPGFIGEKGSLTAACILTEETGQQGMLSRCYKMSHERS